MRKLWWLLGCAALGFAPQGPAPAVEVKIVRHAELAELIRAQQGKVVLVDFWATSCVPCKLSMPHVVEMQRQYAARGLVVIAVATDELEKGTLDRARKILHEKGAAALTNVLLNEPLQVLTDTLRVKSLPCIYVFGRDGKWKQFIGEGLEKDANHRYPTVEAWVKELLDRPAPP